MAQDRIKGITIEIDGNTSKLSDSLKDVNKEIKDCKTALSDVDKLLKLDPSNVTLLKQKQSLLKEEIEATSKKLATEKDALKNLKNDDTTGDVAKQQDALEREIAETESQLKSLKGEYKDFGSVGEQVLKNVGNKMQSFGATIGGVGSNLTKYVTAPIIALGTASIAAYGEVDDGLDIVRAMTGATGEEMESMEGIVKDIASQIPSDFNTIGTAVGELSTRFGLTGDDLENLSLRFIQFSTINNTDVAGSIDTTQKALAAFGLDASNTGALLDALNATGQSTGTSMDTLLNGLVKNGTAFQEMGLSIDQAVVAMGMMETSGASADVVMQGLQKALKNATNEGIPLDEALKNLQNTIINGTGATDGLTASYELFGKSGDQIYNAVKNGTLDFEAMGSAAAETSESVVNSYESMLDPTDRMTVAINNAKIAFSDLGEVILTEAAPIIEVIIDVIKDLTEKFRSLTPEQQENIVKIVALTAVIGPLISAVGGLTGAIGLLVGASNPVVAVVLAIIAVGTFLITHWDEVKFWAGVLWDSICIGFDWMGQKIKKVWDDVVEVFKGAWDKITFYWNWLVETAKSSWKLIEDNIVNPIKNAVEKVQNAFEIMKGIFNITFPIPKIKMPHISVSGDFSLIPLRVPHFSIDWYKKAYDNPVMFNEPTVMATPSGMKGFGDGNGGEIVIGMNKLQELVGKNGNTYAPTFNVYAQPGENTEALARRIQDQFVRWEHERQGAMGIA